MKVSTDPRITTALVLNSGMSTDGKEASLIHYLNPAANDRDEEQRHGLLGDGERLDRTYLEMKQFWRRRS